MSDIHYKGHNVPLVTKTGAPGDISKKFEDEEVSASENAFIHKNQELQSAIGSSPKSPPPGAAGTPAPLEDLVRRSTLVEIPTPTSRVIYQVTAVFPFDLFPDTLIIDELKVNFVYRTFLQQQVFSILIKDISDVTILSTPFFASITVSGGDYQGIAGNSEDKGPLTMSHLNKNGAMRARRIIMGLMIYSDQKVDTSQLSINEIIQKTSELGRAREV